MLVLAITLDIFEHVGRVKWCRKRGSNPRPRHYDGLGPHRVTTWADAVWHGCKRAGDFMLQSDETDLDDDASGQGTAEKQLAAKSLLEMLQLGNRRRES